MSDQYHQQPSVLSPVELTIPIIVDSLPCVACAVHTRLQLDLLLQQSSIDLGGVAATILSDPGATLQVLRLIGEEFPVDDDRPVRMEDCIAVLNHEHWYGAVCESTIPQSSNLMVEWERMRETARCAKALAHSIEGFAPDQAYLVGMFHELGHLPRLLNWQLDREWPSNESALGVMLAEHWKLPRFLVHALREQQSGKTASRWGVFMHFAKSIAERRVNFAASQQD
jgi:hypothetical protein